MKVAVFGGSFDPPHLGHVQVLQYLAEKNEYDQIWVVPAATNPFKEIDSDFDTRLGMCHLAFDEISDKIEILTEGKGSTGYTIDLIHQLQEKYPEVNLTFVGGSDLKENLNQWKNIGELKQLVPMEFLPRPPDPESPFLPITSTEIRALARQGKSIGKWVPKQVEEFIQKHCLYKDKA